MKVNVNKYLLSNWKFDYFPIRRSFRLNTKHNNRLKRSLKKLVKNRMFKDLDKE